MQLFSDSQVVIITGATRGLGLALTKRYAANGWTVVGCGRSEKELSKLRVEMGAPHMFTNVDVSKDEEVAKWAQEVIAKLGTPTTLINNAGIINRASMLWQVPASEFNQVININLIGPQNCIRHFVPAMIEAGRGCVINISSSSGREPHFEYAPYCASKFAIEGLTKCLALELPKGIVAVTLDPGPVNTDMLRSASDDAANYRSPEQWIERAFPLIMSISTQDSGKTLIVPEE